MKPSSLDRFYFVEQKYQLKDSFFVFNTVNSIDYYSREYI